MREKKEGFGLLADLDDNENNNQRTEGPHRTMDGKEKKRLFAAKLVKGKQRMA